MPNLLIMFSRPISTRVRSKINTTLKSSGKLEPVGEKFGNHCYILYKKCNATRRLGNCNENTSVLQNAQKSSTHGESKIFIMFLMGGEQQERPFCVMHSITLSWFSCSDRRCISSSSCYWTLQV